MQAAEPSRTACSTALMRAAHSRLDPEPLIQDPWGERLIDAPLRARWYRESVTRIEGVAPCDGEASADAALFEALRASPAFANVILRTRYTEDALRTAVATGTQQYVLVGAGLDSFALRRPDWAQSLRIVEIDHPATQRFKLERLCALGVPPDPRTHYIGADLATESLAAALARAPHAHDTRSFFSWLGVSMYLTPEANLATLRSIAQVALPGSRLSFTYLEARTLAEPSERFRKIEARVRALGEPFLSGFEPSQLAAQLASVGLTLLYDVTGADAAARYGRRSFARAGTSHIALAEVTTPP